MKHHQEDQVRAELAARQVVFFVGARGTGKTLLKGNLAAALRDNGVDVVELDALDVNTPGDLNEPLALALGVDPALATDEVIPSEKTIRVLIDNCEHLHTYPWLAALQDQWRGLLSLDKARGRIGVLLLGRPLFRGATAARGSPLINIGTIVPAKPLTANDASAAFGTNPQLAGIAVRKTGGNPYLTLRLLERMDDSLDDIGTKVDVFAGELRRHLMRLIDDHGIAARPIIADLLDAPQPVATSALVGRHFGRSVIEGDECLEDLAGSGLIGIEDGLAHLKAEFIKRVPDIRTLIGIPEVDIPQTPTDSFISAAEIVFVAENALRACFARWLAEVDQAWWPARMPEGFVADAELRRRAELDSRAASADDRHPIIYLTFGELVSAVSESANWQQVFRVRLGLTRTAFDEAVKDFTAVRNKVAHNRVVTEDDVHLIQRAAERLGVIDSGPAPSDVA